MPRNAADEDESIAYGGEGGEGLHQIVDVIMDDVDNCELGQISHLGFCTREAQFNGWIDSLNFRLQNII